MIIYKIQNNIDGKIYIGQTVYSFEVRYRSGKWWNLTSCKHLKYAAKKYGIENFSVEILERDVSSVKLLDELERSYISKFNCMEPLGYNIASGGNSHHFYSREHKITLSKIMRGTEFFQLKNQVTGEIRKIENAKEFSIQEEVSDGQVCDVVNGKILSVKNWTLPHITLRHWIIEHDNGDREKIIENSGPEFCKKLNMSYSSLRSLLKGFKQSGWRVVFFQPRIGWEPKKQKPRTHPKTEFLNQFLSGERAGCKYFFLRNLISGEIFKIEDSFCKYKRIKDMTGIKCGNNALSEYFRDKSRSFLDDKFFLCNEKGDPLRKLRISKSKLGKEKLSNLSRLFGDDCKNYIK